MENNGLSQGERFFQEIRTATFRKEEYQYIHTGIIDETGDTWTTTELDEANVFQVYNQYRTRHGIPFPDEIAGLRKHYGLSSAKMSQILGFGINQYRMYEDGEVPSIFNARTIIAAKEKVIFMAFVEASKADLTESEYIRIKNKVESADGDFVLHGRPSELTGYRSLSYVKIESIVQKIVQSMGATFVTKMNKLMFYIDFISYKRHGYGITGLSYRALQFGPVPVDWAKIYSSLPCVEMEEFVYTSGQSGIQLKSSADCKENDLDDRESSIVEYVCGLFKDMNAGEISKISHSEKAWLDNQASHAEISYQNAFSLNF